MRRVVVAVALQASLLACGSQKTPPPPAPGEISANPGNGKAYLTWTASPGAASYTVHLSTVPSVWPGATRTDGITATEHVVSGLTNGTTYYLTVTATNAEGKEGSAGRIVQASPCLLPAPTNVSAAAGDGRVTVTWSAVLPPPGAGLLEYTVRKLMSDCESLDPSTYDHGRGGIRDPFFAYTGLSNGTAYCFRVLAVTQCPMATVVPPVSLVGSTDIALGDQSNGVVATPAL
ncbi:MAG: fibronectin type III domain-containing protein [Deltaproteobacteria bacterium]|nr:fibronectin type III domain-containing protein [Deltaproteobacteria bacterium]